MEYDKNISLDIVFPPEETTVLSVETLTGLGEVEKILKRRSITITWGRETEASAHLVFKGRSLKSLGLHNDFYGPMTSCESWIKEASTHMERWGIEKTSEVEFHVVAEIIDRPTLGFVEKIGSRNYYKKFHYDSVFFDVPTIKTGTELNMETLPYDDRKAVREIRHSQQCVWKSSNSGEENARIKQLFKDIVFNPDRSAY